VGHEDTKEEEREEDSKAEEERERLDDEERTLLATKTARAAKEHKLWLPYRAVFLLLLFAFILQPNPSKSWQVK
jgi:hypothetical protein